MGELGFWAGEGTDLAWVDLGEAWVGVLGKGQKKRGLRRARREGARIGIGGGVGLGGREETS